MWQTILERLAPRPSSSRLELQAESIAVSIRWFGLVIGLLLANFGMGHEPVLLNGMLSLGLIFTAFDTYFSIRGRVLLRDMPLLIAALEALFIGLLCYFHIGLDSAFRFYYLLSLICCAMRYSSQTTFVVCGLDLLSYSILFVSGPLDRPRLTVYLFTLVILLWITWAAGALARLLKRTGDELQTLNAQLLENQTQLESRIAERTRELEESQAQVLHQEKMAAFGLLAAGIAHEVGNPLTSISNVVQILDRREPDEYTRDKLSLVNGQLARIQGTLRELITFSRPASDVRSLVPIAEVITEALGIAKYYKGGKNRNIVSDISTDLVLVTGVRDQLVQVIFNLVLNAIDATGKGGEVKVCARPSGQRLTITVQDDGVGIAPLVMSRLFKPYITTKKHGTGLGLFVTRRIVEDHGGTLQVSSVEGAGATFTITLPGTSIAPRKSE